MSALTKKKRFGHDEYLALEETAEYRSEYVSGEIFAMAGGSLNHVQITSNVSRYIGNRISDDCRALTSDMKVYVAAADRFYYPDVTVLRGAPVFYDDRSDTLTNPVLIVEVLSDSTEARDRGEKMPAYRTLESLREYVLASQTRPVVEQYAKNAAGEWIHRATIGVKSSVRLESVGVELGLGEIYQRIEFAEENL